MLLKIELEKKRKIVKETTMKKECLHSGIICLLEVYLKTYENLNETTTDCFQKWFCE